MASFIDELYDQLDEALRNIHATDTAILKKASEAINVCQAVLQSLRVHVDQHPLENPEAEIIFFKSIKPKFYSQFIYYVKIFQIEINRPNGSDEAQIEYLNNHQRRLTHFFANHQELYTYYRSGASHLDELYFVRGQHDLQLLPDDIALTIDPHFCTAQSYKLAKLLANDQLKVYLDNAIADIVNVGASINPLDTLPTPLNWTGPKVALVELIYALQDSGVLNNGNADIKKIVTSFEAVFGVKLGNFYNAFQEMRLRKKNRSVFLDDLRERLLRRMDEADEG